MQTHGLTHFFLNLMIKLSTFNKLRNINKYTKLSKDFGELNDKLAIEHFDGIHIHTFDIYNVFFKF